MICFIGESSTITNRNNLPQLINSKSLVLISESFLVKCLEYPGHEDAPTANFAGSRLSLPHPMTCFIDIWRYSVKANAGASAMRLGHHARNARGTVWSARGQLSWSDSSMGDAVRITHCQFNPTPAAREIGRKVHFSSSVFLNHRSLVQPVKHIPVISCRFVLPNPSLP